MSLPIVYHRDYVTPLPDGHRFPMPKFKLLYDLLITDGITTPESTHTPEVPTQEIIQLVHTPDYVGGGIL